MFESLLIANRGEIACRVVRTAKRLGLRTIAVHSEADADALHVALADEARSIGPAAAAESYLNAEAVLEAARASGAEAVHPGYGFLAENADFAEACAAAGLVFVGPPVPAIRAMGAKDRAKQLMEKASVPLVPGEHGKQQGEKRLAAAAERIGYPVLIKPAAGGGGKGMRLVEGPGDFAVALEGARREAASAFGDAQVILEKYLERPRHVEVQVFADRHGNAVHLFERDCSIQRRHQKVIEEAPAPGLGAELRAEMGATALMAARAIGYEGAGTVEFLLADGSFYFIEMNTRLQVEHPVTEMITGQDLVEWQLRVAAGEPLPCGQDALAIGGHAIEARLYAEDPARDFLPATGRLEVLRFPETGEHVRVDSGVREGDRITVHYDPMIAKLIVHGADRTAAVRRLAEALDATRVAGLATNLGFLKRIAAEADFAAGRIDTGFIERHAASLMPVAGPPDSRVLALASLAVLLRRAQDARALAARSADPFSPWHRTDGWRLNTEHLSLLQFDVGEPPAEIEVRGGPGGYRLGIGGTEVHADGRLSDDGILEATLNGERLRVPLAWEGAALRIEVEGLEYALSLHDPLAGAAAGEAGGNRLMAPMPGKVVKVHVADGDEVARGAALMVLEAMKMEHTIVAPMDGTVAAVHYKEADLVEEGADLIDLEPRS